MNRNSATQLTRDLLDQNGLPDWKIRLVTELRNPFLGKCVYDHKCIYLNAHHIDTHNEELVKDTILHEIAHALTPGCGHNEVWKAKAKELGSDALDSCASFGLSAAAIDAVRSGDIVECEVITETTVRKTPKYTIHKLQDICPECGKVAKELASFECEDGLGNYCKMITLTCFHIIKKIIPKPTAFDTLTTYSDKPCKHEWNKTVCISCGANRLFPFQVEGAQAIEKGLAINKGFAVFDEMGLGKTIQALAYLKFHPEACPFLWVGKSGIKYQYFKEILKWLGPEYIGQIIATSKDGLLPGLKSYIISYDLLKRLPKDKLAQLGIKTVILDECQAVKNPDSSRTQEVRDLVRNVEHVIPLSGTFWKNRGSEAFVTLNMLDAKRFNSFERFKNHDVEHYWEGNKYKEGGLRLNLMKEVGDLCIRRERKEVMPELPLINRTSLYCEVPEHARTALNKELDVLTRIYNDAVIDGTEGSFKATQDMMQSLIVMRQIVGLAKVPATIEFVSEFLENTDRKLVVFVHHKAVGLMITEQVRALASGMNGDAPTVLQLTADKSSEERFAIQTEFNSSKRAILIASTLASGEGLNLQSCSDCVMHERQWNPANEEQAEGRFIRIGQEATSVNATYMTAEDSVDSSLHGIVEKKRLHWVASMSNGVVPSWGEADIIKDLVADLVRKGKRK